jgi:ABC-type sugar transport system permease subunit
MRPTTLILFVVGLLAVLCVLGAVVVFPLGYMAAVSLTDRRAFSDDAAFVGLRNYAAVIRDPAFRRAAFNAFLYAGGSTAGQMIVGTAMALLLAQWTKRVQNVLRVLLLAPYMLVPTVITVYVWRFLSDPDVGILTRFTGITLFSPQWVMIGLILVSVWVFAPFVMVLVSARLRQIPRAYYETVALDGAGAWRRFRYVTLPQILPILLATSALRFVLMATKFDLPYLLLGSGPSSLRHGPIAVYLYEVAYERAAHGLACAAAILLCVALLLPIWGAQRWRIGVNV